MKIPLVAMACFVLSGSAAVAGVDSKDGATAATLQSAGCASAEDTCHSIGGGQLCNDRCKECSGPSGKYARGDCCGALGHACCCYYE